MVVNKEGQRVPEVTFRTRNGEDWVDVRSEDIFKGKSVVVFALPGAFTPTCSATHLPGYNERAAELKARGVDSIVCLSVNDGFVMEAWSKDQHAENVVCIPDGNGEFTKGMGMLVDKSDLGFGPRSWRYSMLVRDGVIDKMFIEPEVEGDPFEVSDADTMLGYLGGKPAKEEFVTVFTRPGCPHCARAKAALKEHGCAYEEIELGNEASTHTLRAVTGRTTVPQVFIDGKHIGGADELEAYLADYPRAA